MGGLVKTNDDVDCRAISDDFLKKFLPKESENEKEYNYNAFLELVKQYSNELVLCFRGNNARYEAVCIYYRNHLVYKIEYKKCKNGKEKGQITISFNHARYSGNYEYYWKKITRDYGFAPTDKHREEEVPSISLEKNKSGYRANIGYITGCFKERAASIEHVENIYTKCLQPMIDKWFEEEETTDYFGVAAKDDPQNKNIENQILTGPTKAKAPSLEKIRQQQLFCVMKDTQNGYFFFDMEFAQKSSKGTKDNEKKEKNQPDMLAIHFKDGSPIAYVLVEVKSTKGSWSGKSGIRKHLEKMKKYLEEEKMKARHREAALIMSQYKALGLYPSLADIDEKVYETLTGEILLIVTDDVVSKYENEFDKVFEDTGLNNEYEKVPHGDMGIHLPKCKRLEFVEIKKES